MRSTLAVWLGMSQRVVVHKRRFARAPYSALLALLVACGGGASLEDAGPRAGSESRSDAGGSGGTHAGKSDGGYGHDASSERDAGRMQDAGRERDSGADAAADSGSDAAPPHDATVPLKVNGKTCAAAADCGSGFCVDGVCCEAACQGECQACVSAKTAQLDGRCEPVLADTDPDTECAGLTCRTGVCDGAGACKVAEDGTLCRAAIGSCDVAESCAQGACPADSVVASGQTCRATAGACDAAESCDGVSGLCPADTFAADTVVCRAAAGACDAAEHCPGDSADCPNDLLAQQGVECRAQSDVCDVAESCNGTSSDCPIDMVLPEGTVCRAAQGPCDRTEYCGGGTIKTCGADAKLTTVCRPAAGTCDLAESCDGIDNTCPNDLFRTSAASVCAGGAFCSGSSAACVECRDHNDCVGAEVCSAAHECITVKRVFATSSGHTGNLGGLAGADGICQSLADAEGLSGTYKAWLSSSTVSASSRLTHASIPYYLPNNTKIADDWADLVDGTIDNALDANEAGVTLSGFLPWTNATQAGGIATSHCSDWTSSANAQFGSNGSSTRTDLAWTLYNIRRCDTLARLYCFQQ